MILLIYMCKQVLELRWCKAEVKHNLEMEML